MSVRAVLRSDTGSEVSGCSEYTSPRACPASMASVTASIAEYSPSLDSLPIVARAGRKTLDSDATASSSVVDTLPEDTASRSRIEAGVIEESTFVNRS